MVCRFLLSSLLALTGLVFLLPAQAAQSTKANEDRAQLDAIFVTASRTPQPQSETLAATTVITREEIERLQPQSVQELLRWTPGISVSNQGGAGKNTSIYIRGTNSTHTLVLINGVRYTSATTGTPAIQDIPVSQIKRIEIVRGPRSSLYGQDAIGGVIQIFTRDGTNVEGNIQPYVSVGGGTYDTYSATVGMSGNTDDSHFNLSFSRKNTDGFNANNNKGEPDKDGYSRTSGSLRAGFSLGERAEINVHALRVESELEFDAGKVATADHVRQVYGVSASGQLFDVWHTQLSLGRSLDEIKGTSVFNSSLIDEYTYQTSITSVRWQNDFVFSEQLQLMAGVDFRDVQINSSYDYDKNDRQTTGVFVQYLGTFGNHQIQVALRGDEHETYDDSVTGSINYGWHLDSVHTLTLSYGTAYNVPKFNYLYYPFLANPNLKPEESESYEIGFKADRQWGQWAVYAYQTQIDNLIVSNLNTGYVPKNISKARIRGLEASIDTHFEQWFVNASASYTQALDRSDGTVRNNQLPHRPKYSAKVRLNRQFSQFGVGASVKYGGSRYEGSKNNIKLDDFVLVGLRGKWNVTSSLQFQASIDNLFDTDYATEQYYNQPGRAFYVSLSYRP